MDTDALPESATTRTHVERPLKHAERLTEIVHRYTVEGQGTTTIAKATGVPSTTVVSMLERAGIPLRHPSRRHDQATTRP